MSSAMQQPKALKVLFLTEMCERYGFYIAQSMLVLYMIEHFNFSDADAYMILGQFTAMLFLFPVIGGWVADQILGSRFAILIGAVILCVGYAFLASEGHVLFLGLSLLVIGNSLLKPNISSFLGSFYKENDPRCEAGFTLFYVGINIGSLLAMISAGYIRAAWSWMACFGTASIALIIALLIFQKGAKRFENKGLPPNNAPQKLFIFLKQKRVLFLWLLAALTVIYFAMTFVAVSSYGLYLLGFLFCGYVMKAVWNDGVKARQRMLALLLLFLFNAMFWAMYFQQFFAINVLTERVVDRVVWGHIIPPSAFLGLVAIVVVVLGPLFSMLWRSGKLRISIPVKFSLAVLFLTISMGVLTFAISDAMATQTLVKAGWLVAFYFILTIGELFISPIGLALVAEYAPQKCRSVMMGGWFMSVGFGAKLTGVLAQYAAIPHNMMNLHDSLPIYQQALQRYTCLGLIVFAISLILVPFIQKWLNEKSRLPSQ